MGGELNISDGQTITVASYAPTPEPSLVWVLGAALFGIAAFRRFGPSKPQ